MSDVYRVSDIAVWFEVTPATVRRWGKAGRLQLLRSVRTGQYRVSRLALVHFARQHGYLSYLPEEISGISSEDD